MSSPLFSNILALNILQSLAAPTPHASLRFSLPDVGPVEDASLARASRPMDALDQRFPMIGLIVTNPLPFVENATSICTGTLVGPRTVLTAEHCIIDDELPPGSRLHATFYPGFNGLNVMPNGTMPRSPYSNATKLLQGQVGNNSDFIHGPCSPSHMIPPVEWAYCPECYDTIYRNTCRNTADWAVLILEEPLGETLGFMDVASLRPQDVNDTSRFFSHVGYGGGNHSDNAYPMPRIRQHASVIDIIDFPYGSEDSWSRSIGRTNAPGSPGDSGGPFFVPRNETQGDARSTLYGILVGGPGAEVIDLPPNRTDYYYETVLVSGENIVKRVQELNAAYP